MDEKKHIYTLESYKAGKKAYWKCEFRSCKGRVHTSGKDSSDIVFHGAEHSHAPKPGRHEALKLRTEIKEKAQSAPTEPPRNIIADALGTVQMAVSAQVPTITNLGQTIRPQRNNWP